MSDGLEAPRGVGPERLLPLACLAGAALLFASELMTTFELTPPGTDPQCAQSAIDRHHYAPIVLAVAAAIFVLAVWLTGSKPAAIGVAACGVLALLIFLVIDLPDANNVGTISDSCTTLQGAFIDAKAVPQPGFWLELIGSLALAISGLALASLTSEQLSVLMGGGRGDRAPARRPRSRRRERHAGDDAIADAERFGEELSPRKPSGNDAAASRRARPRRGG